MSLMVNDKGVQHPIMELSDLMRQLDAAHDIDTLRALVQSDDFQRPLPTPSNVRLALMIALRAVELLCEAIDHLLSHETQQGSAAMKDTGVYRPCPRNLTLGKPDQHHLLESMYMLEVAEQYLRTLEDFDCFAAVVTGLVDFSAFYYESDDLIIHRCLLATHALSEVYMRALQGNIAPDKAVRVPQPPRYPKDNVKQAVVRSAHGPILGHHQIMTLNCATCSDTKMSPTTAFISYKDNLCWFNDWATAEREDGDILTEINSSMTSDSPITNSTIPGACARRQEYKWRDRNRIGDKLSRWLAQLDHVTKQSSNPSLTHSGVLCTTKAWTRKLIVASVCYGSYHFWPASQEIRFTDYVTYICSSIGGMVRGWAIDHDSEAAIGEHNLLNWLCRDCAIDAARETLYPANALAARDDFAMRIAWGPQTYFYFGQRHHGFKRRVDNLAETIASPSRHLHIQDIYPFACPVKAGDQLSTIVAKLLGLCGAKLIERAADALDDINWDCFPRICSLCDFDGSRAQLFMVSVGAARLAAKLPEPYRATLISLFDSYGFRLFPALQSRMLLLCPCLPRWMADVMSCGYVEAGMRCGQSDCSLTSESHLRAPQLLLPGLGSEETLYDGIPLTKSLLNQARIEASSLANKSGQREWFGVVSMPLRV
ncbi:hypothetical protein CDV55_104450 [Aspergillus turcosus]|uniref:Uncharacterized protein n=1 Tax=Aspergillus turcosus TaxID=1245748 RepID=A0A229WXJ2_9EURO|nr:hypothetical protein CDV55_104450 [Aspergillus turcosus]RLL95715.1 hypothetical protein CFD26_102489 [Aspergillus turcosus]